MRIILALPLLALAACNITNDAANDQVRIQYNEERIENVAADVRDTAGDVARSVGNVATTTGRAVRNEVGDIDVDVDINRNRSGNSH